MRSLRTVIGTLAVAAGVTTAAGASAPTVHFHVFARTGLRLTDVVWTGRQFLYVDNTTNRVAAAGPSGMPLRPFAQMPRQVEETRCRLSPGAHGFAAGDLYCHSPDNKIYRISPNGKTVTVLCDRIRSLRLTRLAYPQLYHARSTEGLSTRPTAWEIGVVLFSCTWRR